MEKEKKHGVLAVKKKNIVLGTFLAVSLSVAMTDSISDCHEGYKYIPYPQSKLKPVEIQDRFEGNDDKRVSYNKEVILPALRVEQSFPPAQSIGKEKLNEYNQQKIQILSQMEKRPDLFPDKQIADVKMYYPIWKTIADKLDFDWEILFVTAEAESGASSNPADFNPNARFWGGYQRDRLSWPETQVQKVYKDVFSDFSEIASLPTRNKSDVREAAFAGFLLSKDFHQYEKLGRNNALLNAFKLYTWSDSEAQNRLDRFNSIYPVLSPAPVILAERIR